MHAAIVREMGEIEILYNNAANEGTIMGLHARIEDVSMEEMENCWRSILELHSSYVNSSVPLPSMQDYE